MRRDGINYLAVGAVTVAALGLLLLALLRITGGTGASDRYLVDYAEVAGVRFGTPVYYQGYRIGQVEDVTPVRDGVQTRFEVALAIDRGWPIPVDSMARLASDGLLSDVFIRVTQGSAAVALAPGDRITSEEGVDLFAVLGDLAAEAQGLAREELRPLLRDLGGRLDEIADPLASGAPEIVAQLRDLLATLGRGADAAEAVLSDANRDTFRRTLTNFEASSSSAAALAEELRGTRATLDAALAEIQGLVSENRPDLRRLVTGLEASVEQLGGRLGTIAYNLEDASRHFNEFARIIRRNPNRLLYTRDSDPGLVGEGER